MSASAAPPREQEGRLQQEGHGCRRPREDDPGAGRWALCPRWKTRLFVCFLFLPFLASDSNISWGSRSGQDGVSAL